MGISSLGVGSSILTQDVLDQLRTADESGLIKPVEFELANENDKQEAMKIIDATMTNFIDSITAIKSATLWNERSATVTGTSVEVTAAENTDIQDFSLNVTALATKQIEQSGAFTAKTDVVDAAAGTFDIQVGTGTAVTINYAAGATLDDIKNLINDNAGSLVDATIVQINSGEFRLFLSSDKTGAETAVGAGTDISITSASGLDTKLTTDFNAAAIQSGTDSAFTFNGQAITRASNSVSDLITGLTVTLKETGTSAVSVAQDRTSILGKFDSFVEKYNSSIVELDKMTKVSVDSNRGIFSSDSTIKSMKRAIANMMDSVGGGVGSMIDYGFSIDKDGKMSLDKTALEKELDTNPINTQAFFSGGDYTDPTTSVVTTLTGVFAEMAVTVESYTKTNKSLDQLSTAISENISSLEDRKTTATERLDAKYAIMKKQWAAYDLVISKFNSASSVFTQLANAQTNN